MLNYGGDSVRIFEALQPVILSRNNYYCYFKFKANSNILAIIYISKDFERFTLLTIKLNDGKTLKGCKMDNTNTERTGVHMVGYIVESELEWTFREQSVSDFGIDAEIEIKHNGCRTGRLIAVQVKSGDSYFKGEKTVDIIFHLDERHVQYWLNHSLPVIIVLYNPEDKICIWEYFSKPNIFYTKSKKPYYHIRRNRFLNKESREALDDLPDADIIVKHLDIIKRFESIKDSLDIIDWIKGDLENAKEDIYKYRCIVDKVEELNKELDKKRKTPELYEFYKEKYENLTKQLNLIQGVCNNKIETIISQVGFDPCDSWKFW